MGTHVIKVPDIGEGIAEVELVAWHVKAGDTIAEDQALADVMTDKATVEIPSPVAGTVSALGGELGQTIAVGAELIRIEIEGEGNVAAGGPTAKGAADKARTSNAKIETTTVPATGTASTRTTRAPGDKPIASPAVRRRARELDIALETVRASGPAGRIVHADLDAHAARGTASAKGRDDDARYAVRDGEETVKVIGLRRKIAQKMQESKRRIPHYSYVEEVDVTEIEALRARLNERWGADRGRLTLLPLLVRAIVLAVREFPQVNARFDDESGVITRYGAAHVGIATQTDSGLIVPVLAHAEARDPWDCAAEIARLASAAREGTITRDELGGSTITITSLGALGGIATTPVINRPEVAIVGVNRIVERPMIRSGAVVARSMMNLSSSFDHRVVDGMDAARFIQSIRAYLETPALLFVE